MPTVPTYNKQMVQERPLQAPSQNIDLSPDAFGGGQAIAAPFEALSKLNQTAIQIATDEKKIADNTASKETWAKTVEFKNRLLYDEKEGAYTKRGKNAFGVIDDYGERFKKGTDEIEKTLGSEDQRIIYRGMRLQIGTELNDILQKHTFNEAQQFASDTLKSGIDVAQSDAILNYQEQGKVDQSLNLQKNMILGHAQDFGLSEEAARKMLETTESSTHVGVIKRMLANNQDLDAKAYYDARKDGIVGPDITTVEAWLKEGNTRGEARRLSDQIMSTNPTMAEAMEEVKKIEDTNIHDQVYSRIKLQLGDRKVADDIAQEERFNRISNVVEQSKGREQIPIDQWLSLSLGEKNAIDARIRQLRSGVDAETDWSEYYNLKTLGSSPATRNDFKQMNLLLYRTKLADPEFKELVGLQTSLRAGDGKAEGLLDGYRSHSQIVDDTLRDIGLDPTAQPGSEKAQKVNQFRKMVDDQVISIQQQTGKKIMGQDLQKVVDSMAVKVITSKGFLWDTKGRAFEVTIDQIDEDERRKIESALKDNGYPVTDKNILDLYKRVNRAK